MDLLIHVGLHKTGTTAVQQLLYSKSADFKGYGILYPDAGIFPIQHALIPLAAFCESILLSIGSSALQIGHIYRCS